MIAHWLWPQWTIAVIYALGMPGRVMQIGQVRTAGEQALNLAGDIGVIAVLGFGGFWS